MEPASVVFHSVWNLTGLSFVMTDERVSNLLK